MASPAWKSSVADDLESRLAPLGAWSLRPLAPRDSLTSPLLATLAGAAGLAGLSCFLVNVTRIAAHARPAAVDSSQYAPRASLPRIGKEGHIS